MANVHVVVKPDKEDLLAEYRLYARQIGCEIEIDGEIYAQTLQQTHMLFQWLNRHLPGRPRR
jgi:hypothetical protein